MPSLISLSSAGSKKRAVNWATASGRLLSGTTMYTTRNYSTSVSATTLSGLGVVYSVISGSLPGGMSLNSSNGAISGTINNGIVSDFTSNNNFSFTLRATEVGSGVYADRNFNFLINSYYVGYSCMSCGEGETASMSAPSGYIFTRVDFSSYGTPNGGCGGYSTSGCHAYAGMGMPAYSVSINANNNAYGDPCNGTRKRYYGQCSYSPV